MKRIIVASVAVCLLAAQPAEAGVLKRAMLRTVKYAVALPICLVGAGCGVAGIYVGCKSGELFLKVDKAIQEDLGADK
jgi:hypothetical protein